ncbi:MAG: FimB/Mfa2 family fimbrial subunit [Bacteroidaceae bacterium]|nr:FimB/Mfa2 family fimbrial subunit [Bacteroidaceae bacterium]
MKRTFGKCMVLAVMALCLSACEKSSIAELEEQGQGTALLEVYTRTTNAGEEATVSYPVSVYVFSGEKCVALQTITSAAQALNILLTEGNYTVLTIGGATSENYVLPSKSEATPDMSLVLKEGKSHGDLMMAKNLVVLKDGQTNSLSVTLERKVALLQSVLMENIPSSATEVTLTLSPLWTSMAGIEYAGAEGQTTVALTKQEDGKTWSFTGEKYLLPPSGAVMTVKVRIVKPNGTTTYTYNIDETVEAGDKLNISSTYTGSLEVTMTGTIAGDAWKSEKNISFEFNEEGGQTVENPDDTPEGGNPSDENDDVVIGTIPTVGSTYQTCYVLSVTEKEGISEVLLLSPTQQTVLAGGETQDEAREKVEAAMAGCGVSGISGWRLMTFTEAEVVCQSNAPNLQSGSNHRYLLEENGVVKAATFGSGTVTKAQSFASTNLLRPVTILRMKAE